ncbi:MAG: hypothetical protein WCF36_05755 [Candidatus Nanopelagicales bacterium]
MVGNAATLHDLVEDLAEDLVLDMVVDMVLEVDSRGIDVEHLTRSLQLPGRELLRIACSGRIWLTVLVPATSAQAAIAAFGDRVLGQVPTSARARTVALDCCSLGELYGGLDPHLRDADLDRIDVLDLVERRFWHATTPTTAIQDLCDGLLSSSA